MEPTKNPYQYGKMLPADSPVFFGREREQRELITNLCRDEPQSMSIVGERRIGKSSLAWRVYKKLSAEHDTLTCYLSCDALEAEKRDDFFAELGRKINGQLPSALRRGKSSKAAFNSFVSFRHFLETLHKETLRVVFFLDEFEALTKKAFADADFFSKLRFLAASPENCFAWVTVSRRPLKEFTHEDMRSSGFHNIFHFVRVRLLEAKAIEALRRMDFPQLGEKENDFFEYYAGRFPFFNQIAGQFLINAYYALEAYSLDHLEEEVHGHLHDLWEDQSLDEQHALMKLIRGKAADQGALQQLRWSGLIERSEEKDRPFCGYFCACVPPFQDDDKAKKKLTWPRAKREIQDLLGIIKSIKSIAK